MYAKSTRGYLAIKEEHAPREERRGVRAKKKTGLLERAEGVRLGSPGWSTPGEHR